jgi:predicted DNA binding CopG/RHH family protein
MNKKTLRMSRFKNESEEADWWASPAGRAFVKQKSIDTQSKGTKIAGSGMVAMLNKKSSVQIAIRLPEADLAQAREIAGRKGIGYQTLLKMFVREGLVREARRG